MHRDIKPANIFLCERGVVKLGDLGLGRFFSSNTYNAHSVVGTPFYMSPEVIMGSGNGYSFKSDMWSLGCILFMLLSGEQPFRWNDTAELYMEIAYARYNFDSPIWNTISDEAKKLISGLLILDRRQRLTAHQALKSDWFMNCTTADLEARDLRGSLPGLQDYCENIRPEAKKRQRERIEAHRKELRSQDNYSDESSFESSYDSSDDHSDYSDYSYQSNDPLDDDAETKIEVNNSELGYEESKEPEPGKTRKAERRRSFAPLTEEEYNFLTPKDTGEKRQSELNTALIRRRMNKFIQETPKVLNLED